VNKAVCICVQGRLNDRTEWSFGEATSYNSQNLYYAAMAEKRAKDRVILKLLNLHGNVYSEEEADDFKKDVPKDFKNGSHRKTSGNEIIAAMNACENLEELTQIKEDYKTDINRFKVSKNPVDNEFYDQIIARGKEITAAFTRMEAA
jgi:hypothetical protein